MKNIIFILSFLLLVSCSKTEEQFENEFIGKGVVIRVVDVNGNFTEATQTIVIYDMGGKRYEGSSRKYSVGDTINVYKTSGCFQRQYIR